MSESQPSPADQGTLASFASNKKKTFQKVTMDIFGPLKRTKSAHKYVLVVVDYATKWPEAFLLKNMTSETVINCLIDLTAGMGISEQILTDHGANFISKTMR